MAGYSYCFFAVDEVDKMITLTEISELAAAKSGRMITSAQRRAIRELGVFKTGDYVCSGKAATEANAFLFNTVAVEVDCNPLDAPTRATKGVMYE